MPFSHFDISKRRRSFYFIEFKENHLQPNMCAVCSVYSIENPQTMWIVIETENLITQIIIKLMEIANLIFGFENAKRQSKKPNTKCIRFKQLKKPQWNCYNYLVWLFGFWFQSMHPITETKKPLMNVKLVHFEWATFPNDDKWR